MLPRARNFFVRHRQSTRATLKIMEALAISIVSRFLWWLLRTLTS